MEEDISIDDEYKDASVEGDVKRTIQMLREARVTPQNYKQYYKQCTEAVRVLESILAEKAEELDTKMRPVREEEEEQLRQMNAMPGQKTSTHSQLATHLHKETEALQVLGDWTLYAKEVNRIMKVKLYDALETSNATEALSKFTQDSKEYLKGLTEIFEGRFKTLHDSMKEQRQDFKEMLKIVVSKSEMKDAIIQKLYEKLEGNTEELDELKKLQEESKMEKPVPKVEKKLEESEEEEEPKKYKCEVCDFESDDEEEMLNHIKKEHKDKVKDYA